MPTHWSPTYTPVPTVVEPGLAYGDPCKPPCWWGLIPGQASRQEAAQAIERLRASGWASYISEGPGGYSIQPLPSAPDGSVLVSFYKEILKMVNGTILFYYPIGTVIEQFGEPEGLSVVKGNISKGSCDEWEPPDPPTAPVMSYAVPILYPRQGLAFLVLVPSSGLGLICPEMKVSAFCYYAPLPMREALNNDHLGNLCTIVPKGITEQDLVKWHGFGPGY